jgi:hypothetical protein
MLLITLVGSQGYVKVFSASGGEACLGAKDAKSVCKVVVHLPTREHVRESLVFKINYVPTALVRYSTETNR